MERNPSDKKFIAIINYLSEYGVHGKELTNFFLGVVFAGCPTCRVRN